MEKAICIYDYNAKEANELSVKKNDILDVLEQSKDWWKVKNVYGSSGLVPDTHIAYPVTDEMRVVSRGKLKEAHKGETSDQLTIESGCQVAIFDQTDDYWWFAGWSAKSGYIPKHKIQLFSNTKKKPKENAFQVAPDKAQCEEYATVLLSFQKKLPGSGQFIVVFKGEHCEKAVDAKKYNGFTLQLETPKYHPAETANIFVKHLKTGEAPETIGEGVTFSFESKIDTVHRLLKAESNPMNFLCQSFQVDNIENVDNILSGQMEKLVPEGFSMLKSGQSAFVQKEEHPKETPTLLHFAAFYNLTRLAKTLLKCPGAEQALRVQNCKSMVPDGLAEFKKHSELAELLRNNKSSIDEDQDANQEIYEQMERTYETYASMDGSPSGYVQAKLKPSSTEIYEDMGSRTAEPEQHYDTPRPEDEIYDEVDEDAAELQQKQRQQAAQSQLDEYKVFGRMTEKEVQLALLMKRVKERYITQEQALEMARILRLDPQTGVPPVARKPKMKKKISAPVMDELSQKVKSLPRTYSTSSGSSMSSVGSNASVASSGYTSEEADRGRTPKTPPKFQTASPHKKVPTPLPRKSSRIPEDEVYPPVPKRGPSRKP